jgi:hypothetical protein
MSDFLGDLAARLDGTAPMLRPRLPALFETPVGEAGFAAPRRQAEPDEGFTIESGERDAPAAPRPPAPSRQGSAEPSPRAPAMDRPADPFEPAAAPTQTGKSNPPTHRPQAPPAPLDTAIALPTDIAVDPPDDAPIPAMLQRARKPQIAPVDAEEPMASPPRAPFAASRATDVAAEIADTAPPPAKPQRRNTQQPPPRDAEAPIAPPARAPFAAIPAAPVAAKREASLTPASAVLSSPRETPALPRLSPAPPPFAPLPVMTPTQPLRRADPQVRPREAAEPTIHVTIGRIDIQASGDTSAPRKSRETSPVMSLDDYLRSRARP